MKKIFKFKKIKKVLFFGVLALGIGIFSFWYFSKEASATPWKDDNWKFRKMLTIDHSKVSDADSADFTNFPVLVNITDSSLGSNSQSNGNDIMFTSSDGTTQLDHEIESFDASTGKLVAWVEVPTLDYNDNTILYLYYGNFNCTSQQNITGAGHTWNSNYVGVWHLNNNNFNNSTSVADLNGTNTGTIDLPQARVAGGRSFSASTADNDNILVTDNASLDITGNITVEAWVKFQDLSGGDKTIISHEEYRAGGYSLYLSHIGDPQAFYFRINGGDTTIKEGFYYNPGLIANTWYHLVGVYDGSNVKVYINGTVGGTAPDFTGTFGIANTDLTMGLTGTTGDLHGGLDEVKISNSARTVGWIATEYNNQNSPEAFLSMGSEEKAKNPILYWKLNSESIAAASSVDTSTSASATASSFQRKTWNDGTRYWMAFHSDADDRIEFWYSADGSTGWTEDTSARLAIDTNDFSIEADSTNAFIAYTNGYDVEARSASSYPGTSFSWGAATVVYNGSGASDKYYYPVIDRDSSNNVWINTAAYTNDSTTTDYPAGAGDGHTGDYAPSPGGTWADIHNAASGNDTNYTNDSLLVQVAPGTNQWDEIYRAFYPINTSGLPDTATITAATFNAYHRTTHNDNDPDGNDWVSIVQTSQANPASLVDADYDQCGSVHTPTEGSNRVNIGDMTLSSYVSWTLTSTGRGWIDKTGTTLLGLREGHDILDDPVTGENAVRFSTSEAASNLQPYLRVTYCTTCTPTYKIQAVKSSAANNITGWGTAATLDDSANSNKYGTIVSTGSDNMYAVWIDDAAIEGKAYTSSTWAGSATAIATGITGLTKTLSATTDSSNNIHLVYINSSNLTAYKKYTLVSTAWDASETVLGIGDSNTYPVITLDTDNNDLYAYWVRSGAIYSKKYTSSAWQSPSVWYSTGINTYLSANYSGATNYLTWTQGSASPYNIFFGLSSTTVAENLAKDAGDGNFTGTVSNAVWKEKSLCVDQECLAFDGTNDFVSKPYLTDIGLDPGTSSFTISAWFKHVSTVTGTDYLISRYNGAGYKIYLESDGDLCFAIDADSTWSPTDSICAGSADYNDSKWHQVTASKDGTTSIKIYIDGVLAGTNSNTTADTSLSGISPTFYVGIDSDGISNPWDGFVDEVKVYNYLLTDAQIKANFIGKGNILGVAASLGRADQEYLSEGLVGYWKMDETSGTVVADSSGNSNTGTLTNAQETNGNVDFSASTTTTITDTVNASLSTGNDVYNNMILVMSNRSGQTCAVNTQQRTISDYDGTNKIITVGTAFSATPETNKCIYTIYHQVGGKFGDGVQFDGVNDYLSIVSSSLSPGTGDYTASLWFKTTSTQSQIGTLYRTNNNPSLEIKVTNSEIFVSTLYDGGGEDLNFLRYTPADITNGAWHHLVVTLQRGNIQKGYLFYDGVLRRTSSLSSTAGITNGTLLIGGLSWVNRQFQGSIDEVRTYNKALSPKEVSDLYNFAPGPVGYWNLDDGKGTTANDSSSNSYTGTLTGNLPWSEGKYGKGVSSNGTSGYINLGDILDFTGNLPMTLSAWVRPKSGIANKGHVISKYDSGTAGQWYLDVDSNNLVGFLRECGSYGTTSATALTSDKWQHIAGVYDGTNINIYINGKLDKTVADSCSITDTAVETIIGAGDDAASAEDYFKGNLDEVKVYNYARTQKQIIEDMTGGAPATSLSSSSLTGGSRISSPIIYLDFDEGYLTTGNNRGNRGSSFNGTLNTATWTESGKFGKGVNITGSTGSNVSIPDFSY